MFKAFLSFDSFLFPRIVRLVYAVGLILIVIGTLSGIGGGLVVMTQEGATGAIVAVTALVGGIAGAVVWRLVVELWLVIFAINDNLKAIRDQGRPV